MIGHVLRDYNLTLAEQKKLLRSRYKGFQYLFTISRGCNVWIDFIYDLKVED